MGLALGRRDSRSIERLRYHYEVEKDLAWKLRAASREERRSLYTSLYNELFQRVPDHPQLARRASEERTRAIVGAQMRILDRFLDRASTFLEIGPGDCSLSLEVARRVKRVIAIDVSDEILRDVRPPGNLQLMVSDGCDIPVPRDSVDVAYSHQLIEHLHPEDALEQMRNIYDALAPGGIYVCITPNRLTGPHDISRYFDPVATGFHLKEYTNRELSGLFRRVGFGRLRALVSREDGFALLHPGWIAAWEGVLDRLPYRLRRALTAGEAMRELLGVRMVGTK